MYRILQLLSSFSFNFTFQVLADTTVTEVPVSNSMFTGSPSIWDFHLYSWSKITLNCIYSKQTQFLNLFSSLFCKVSSTVMLQFLFGLLVNSAAFPSLNFPSLKRAPACLCYVRVPGFPYSCGISGTKNVTMKH